MKKVVSLLATFLLLSNIVFADDLIISQFPENPREGQELKLTLVSDKYDMDKATVTWTVDGQVADQGVGRKTFTMKAPTNGIGQIVVARVEQEGYDYSEIERVVEANTNFILYEGADSYVPSFYKGRRLPPKEGTIRAGFFSFKDGSIVGLNDGSSANYTWNINGEDNKGLSGDNKVINNILTRVTDNSLRVKITRDDGSVNRKYSEITIPLQKPEVIVYKTDENKYLKQVLGTTEVAKVIYLLVEPFFFSAPDKRNTDLKYTWKINDIETKILTPWSVKFSGKDTETVKINLEVLNNKKITQEAERGFTFKVQ